ncbi:MAG: LptA/OstA family protein [Thermodesulfobacteriota bacterium]
MNRICNNRFRHDRCQGVRLPAAVPSPGRKERGRYGGTALAAFLWALLAAITVMTGPAASENNLADLTVIGAIRISADALTVPGGTENYAEFKGNVHAFGDRFDITADQLKIFYQPSPETKGDDITSGNSLTKIIASGNVVITSGEKIAKTEEAVYDKAQQTIILSGDKSMVLQNNSYIAGKKIIMHLDSETVTVESGEGKRVEAFIEPRDMKKDN